MRTYFESLGHLCFGVLKWSAIWGGLLVMDAADIYEDYAVPTLQAWWSNVSWVTFNPTPYLAFAALIFAIGATYHRARLEVPASTLPNWPIREAVNYISEESIFAYQNNKKLSLPVAIIADLRQRAIYGEFTIWGTPMGTSAEVPIRKDYWTTNMLKAENILKPTSAMIAHTEFEKDLSHGIHSLVVYARLRVNKNEICQRDWRRATSWQRVPYWLTRRLTSRKSIT